MAAFLAGLWLSAQELSVVAILLTPLLFRRYRKTGLALMSGMVLFSLCNPLRDAMATSALFSSTKQSEIQVTGLEGAGEKARFVFSITPKNSLFALRVLSDQPVDKDIAILEHQSTKQKALSSPLAFLGRVYAVSGEGKAFAKASLPGSFDAADYYGSRGMSARFRIRQAHFLRHTWCPSAFLVRLRQNLAAQCDRQEGESFQFLKRVLLGAQAGGGFSIQEDMKDLGVAHLLAASGLHVHLLFEWGLFIAAFLPFSRRTIAGGLLALLLFYAALLDFPASILRAWLFLAFHEMAIASKRKEEPMKRFLLALCLVLAWRPSRLFDAGLLLSFLCAAALRAVQQLERVHGKGGMFQQSLRQSFWISAFTMPVLVNMGIPQTPSTLLANLFAIPAFTPLFALGVLTFLFGAIPGLGYIHIFLSSLYRLSYAVFRALLKGLSALAVPGVHFTFSSGTLALYALLLAGILLWRLGTIQKFCARLQQHRLPNLLLHREVLHQSLIFFIWVLLTVLRPFFLEPLLPPIFQAVDIGQGDCLMLRQGQRAFLWDTGGKMNHQTGENTQAAALAAYLKQQGITEIEGIFLSHADYDHMGNLQGLLKAMTVKRVITAPSFNGSFQKLPPDLGARHQIAMAGERRTLFTQPGTSGRPITVSVVTPGQWDAEDKNNHCLVMYLDFGGGILLMGDQEEDHALPYDTMPAPLSLLKAAHHGSRKGSSATLLGRLRPAQALISCGADNRYGHPTPETLARLRKFGVPWHRTDVEGHIFYAENPLPVGPRLLVWNQKEARLMTCLFECVWCMPLFLAWKAVKSNSMKSQYSIGKKKAPAH